MQHIVTDNQMDALVGAIHAQGAELDALKEYSSVPPKFVSQMLALSEDDFQAMRKKAEQADQMLAALKQINDWCCFATEENVAARLMALQQIGQLARGAMASGAVGAA